MGALKACAACFGALVVFLIAAGIGFALPITSIVLGAMRDCPLEPKIPVFLIVLGSVTLAYGLTSNCQTRAEQSEDQLWSYCLSVIGWLINVFLVAWIITGTVWYVDTHNKPRSNNPVDDNYCDEVLFNYFYAQIIIWYLLFFLGVVLLCCLLCCFKARDNTAIITDIDEDGNVAGVPASHDILRAGPVTYIMVQSISTFSTGNSTDYYDKL
ncbi:uncharacterized protein [Amphiura filiformis]|uniref:uncharacterized protein n=1 Tax=Amphiura filiformis TaxID=82378 RepID=UPI003B20D22A